jgi:hypothetical protein
MAHDPITAATTTLAPHREPAFRHVDDIAAAWAHGGRRAVINRADEKASHR